MAGGYSDGNIQKHLLSADGNYLFERVISAVPVKNVWIVHNKNTQGFWNGWYAREALTTFADKSISFFLDKQNSQGGIKNPALWMTSGIPSLAMNYQKNAVIYSAIDTYFENFNFMDELMSKENAFVVTKEDLGNSPSVDINWRGKLNPTTVTVTGLVDGSGWAFADMVKASTKNLLVSGQLPKGDMISVVQNLRGRTHQEFDVVKYKGGFANINTPEDLSKAESLYTVQNKVIV